MSNKTNVTNIKDINTLKKIKQKNLQLESPIHDKESLIKEFKEIFIKSN